MPTDSPLNGILLVDKPTGFTSHDVVAKLRGILHMRRIGHGGTLDPLATGVLPVFLGGATKAAEFAAAQEKEYRAGFTLGYCTDTQDSSGQTQQVSKRRAARSDVEQVLTHFLGEQKQVPPMYSAVKINGQKLYELARKGREVERPARDITVHEMELLAFDETAQSGELRLCVSKGAYVRTLIHDIGADLGTFAVMHSLVRTRAGMYALTQCHGLDEIQQAAEAGTAESLFLPVDALFTQYPVVYLSDEGAARAARGAIVFPRMTNGMPSAAGTLCRVYHGASFLMLGQVRTLHIGGVGLFSYRNFR